MGILPSAALKWNAAKEEFMKGVDWVNEMAIRVSAGRTGNDAISTYRSLAALSSTTNGYLLVVHNLRHTILHVWQALT